MFTRLFLFFCGMICIQMGNAQIFNSEMPDPLKPRIHYDPILPDITTDKQIVIHPSGFNQNITVNCPPNIDFEEGSFNNWQCDTGFVRGIDSISPSGQTVPLCVFGPSTTGQNEAVMSSSMPMNNRHTIIQNLGGASPLDPYGRFPIYPPNGSNFAVRLGSDLDFPGAGRPQARAERITYTINVPLNASDFSLTYQYAVVFQDPGHIAQNQPRFNVNLFDPSTNSNVPCGFVEYVADSTIPGFQRSTRDPSVWYKPWAPVFINLSRFAGRTLYLQFTTEDCAQGGHWGYAYLDVNGCELTVKAKNSCATPTQTILNGPDGFATYNWWNSNYTQLLANGQNAISNSNLNLNDTVHLEVIPRSGSSCRDTISTIVTKDTIIYPFATDKTICTDSNAVIGAGVFVNNYTYQWSANTNITATNQASVSVHPLTNTDYSVIITDTISKCKFYDTLKVVVNPSPNLSISPQTICSGQSVLLTVSGADTYVWSPSNGLSSTVGNSVTASPTSTTSYTVTGTASSNGCKSDSTIIVTVNPKPAASFSIPTSQCLNNNSFTFTSSSTGIINLYNWTFDGSSLQTGNPVNYTFTTSGPHNVKLLVITDKGCKDSITHPVQVNPDPVIAVAASGPLNVCQGSTVQLNATVQSGNVQPATYQWYYYAAIIPGATQSSLTVNQSGDYKVVFTNGNGCTTISQIFTITINPLPVATINIPSQNFICDLQPVLLSTTYSGLSYQWFLDGGIIPNANQSSYNAVSSGNYTLQVTSNAGCTSLATGVITLKKYKKPDVDFNFVTGCNIPTIFNNLSDTSMSGQVNWLWNFGDGTQSTLYNPTHTYSNGSNYTVTLTATSLKCPTLSSLSNQFITIPISPAGIRYRTIDALINTNTLLDARAGATSYLWSPSIGLNLNNIQSPIFNHNAQVEYLITLNYPGNCVTVDTLLVRVQRAINISVPTAFSPNGDHHNDYLDIFLIGIKELRFFRVFNRWGQLLFETNDVRQLWDGTYKGKRQPAETYVWIAEGIDVDGKTVIRRGQTILLR